MAGLRYLLIAGLFFLVSCSSGGGTPSSSVMPDPPVVLDPLEQLTALAAANQDITLAAAARVANSLPRLGDGITQSGNRDSDGVSSDRGGTTFDREQLTATIMRENGTPLTFDTATDTAFTFDVPYLPGYTLRSWALISAADEGTSVSYHVVNWNNVDPTDYLAAGYWIHFANEAQPLQFTAAEAGIFIDGPELSTAPVLPDQGQMIFAGPAQGFYIGRYGMRPDIAEGSTEYGEFSSSIRLSADFGEGTIGGCMGCQGGFRISDLFFVDGTTGESRDLGARTLPHQIHLNALLSADGSFRDGRDGGMTTTVVGGNAELAESTGAWGGKLSNIQDANGAPRLVAGTVSSWFKSTLGGEGAFLGTFIGLNLAQ